MEGALHFPLLVLAILTQPLCRVVHADVPAQSSCSSAFLGKFPGGWPSVLDSGIYWFGPQDSTERAGDGSQTRFYNPKQNTVIYFHGWTGGSDGGWTVVCKRETSLCSDDVCPNQGKPSLVQRWLDAGWNVGFFYWDQFADEYCARDAEQKIWFDRGGDGFRWKSYNPSTGLIAYHDLKEGTVSVADLCVKAVTSAMSGFEGQHVRFVGHDIGAQLATRCAALLHEQNSPSAPQRLALLEPYFSKIHLYIFRCNEISTDAGGIGDFTATAMTGYIKSLWARKKVITEIYKSSVLTQMDQFGDPDPELEHTASLVKYEPHWCGGLGPIQAANLGHLNCRHHAVVPLYFLSFGVPSPPVLPVPPPGLARPGSALSSCTTPNAGCSDGQMREWVERQLQVGGQQVWNQETGENSFATNDDSFSLQPAILEVEYGGSNLGANDLVEVDSSAQRSQPPQETLMDTVRKRIVFIAPLAMVLLGGCFVIGALFVHLSRSSSSSGEDEEDGLPLTGMSRELERSSSSRNRQAPTNAQKVSLSPGRQYESLVAATSERVLPANEGTVGSSIGSSKPLLLPPRSISSTMSSVTSSAPLLSNGGVIVRSSFPTLR